MKSSSKHTVSATNSGVNRYMTKPVDLAVLRRRIALMVENWGKHTELVTHSSSDSDYVLDSSK